MRLIELTAISGAELMFDEYLETQTTASDEIEKTFDVTGMNAVVILNNSGVTATLEVDSITQEILLNRDSIKDWWDYWFAPVRSGRDAIFYFPTQTSGNATLTISAPGGTAKCGFCATGVVTDLGLTLQELTLDISDYSIYDVDEFGQIYLSVGNWAKKINGNLFYDTSRADEIYMTIVKNRATPCVFDYNNYSTDMTERHTSQDGLQSLIQYGFVEDFNSRISSSTSVDSTIATQGLI